MIMDEAKLSSVSYQPTLTVQPFGKIWANTEPQKHDNS